MERPRFFFSKNPQSSLLLLMSTLNRIFLIGPMGAGKTTVGRVLADSVGLSFFDSDLEIQRRTGVDISTIFSIEGEIGFRNRETQVIDLLSCMDNIVLATGGGVVLDAANRQRLSERGIVVYLFCSPEFQFERTSRDKGRPLLRSEDPLGTLRGLMEQRDPLYRSIADHVVSTEGRSAASIVKEIKRKL